MIKLNTVGTEQGKKYFTIYEVRAKNKEGKIITIDRYLYKDEAEKYQKLSYTLFKSLYKTIWIREQIVWC